MPSQLMIPITKQRTKFIYINIYVVLIYNIILKGINIFHLTQATCISPLHIYNKYVSSRLLYKLLCGHTILLGYAY